MMTTVTTTSLLPRAVLKLSKGKSSQATALAATATERFFFSRSTTVVNKSTSMHQVGAWDIDPSRSSSSSSSHISSNVVHDFHDDGQYNHRVGFHSNNDDNNNNNAVVVGENSTTKEHEPTNTESSNLLAEFGGWTDVSLPLWSVP